MKTVRDAAFETLRECGMTTMFGNPGSTEVPLLANLPDDISFILGLHEASVVGTASGYALATGRPALALLHTTAGLGNAVGAIATARENRAPLVVLVGQQDRRHLAAEPFLAGRLRGLAGDYPVAVHEPVQAADVPGALRRAYHEASTHRGPCVVVVPMDDWTAEHSPIEYPPPRTVRRCFAPSDPALTQLARIIDSARAPVLIVGARCDSTAAWRAVEELAERIDAPVWQEAFGGGAGFPQDHPRFAGHLPSIRRQLRSVMAEHDLILAIGAPAFRQYQFDDGPFVNAGISVAVVSSDLNDVLHSTADLGIVVDIAPMLTALASLIAERPATPRQTAPIRHRRPEKASERLDPQRVFGLLATYLPRDTALVEETPSSRATLQEELPARHPLGFVSAAMGGLGFALPAAIGIRMAQPTRPVVAILGDGSAMYAIQGLWTAAHYQVGTLFVVLINGRYEIMDRLARAHGAASAPWPGFGQLRIGAVAQGMGCASIRVETATQLADTLAEFAPELGGSTRPMLVEVALRE